MNIPTLGGMFFSCVRFFAHICLLNAFLFCVGRKAYLTFFNWRANGMNLNLNAVERPKLSQCVPRFYWHSIEFMEQTMTYIHPFFLHVYT